MFINLLGAQSKKHRSHSAMEILILPTFSCSTSLKLWKLKQGGGGISNKAFYGNPNINANFFSGNTYDFQLFNQGICLGALNLQLGHEPLFNIAWFKKNRTPKVVILSSYILFSVETLPSKFMGIGIVGACIIHLLVNQFNLFRQLVRTSFNAVLFDWINLGSDKLVYIVRCQGVYS